MPSVTEAAAIEMFADAMNPLIADVPSKGHIVLDAFARFCREVRILNASDGVMLEWGVHRPHLLDGFADIRGEVDVDWEDSEFQWIGFTRQINSTNEDGDTALCVNLFFGPATGSEPSSNIEFFDMAELDTQIGRLSKSKFVSALLDTQPSQIIAFAGEIG